MDGTDLNNITTEQLFSTVRLLLLPLHPLHDLHSQLLHLDHGEVGKSKNIFLSSSHNLLPGGLRALHESLEADDRNRNNHQRLKAQEEHLQCFADEEPLELVANGLSRSTLSLQIVLILWWRRGTGLLNF